MGSMTPHEQRAAVERNVRAYRRRWRRYDRDHGEIFNEAEQRRLRAALERAGGEIRSRPAGQRQALDVGAGTGNVTRHLEELGFEVTAADVSPELLRVVAERLPGVRTQQLAGFGLHELGDESFDMVTAYSVLHHVPDYLAMVEEIVRVLRPGGVAYIDHEASDDFWRKGGCLDEFREAVQAHLEARPGWWNPARKRWQHYLVPANAALALKLRFRPQLVFDVEGDIHTWAWDHVEWPKVERRLGSAGAEAVWAEEYLVYRAEYPRAVWEEYRGRCSDMRLLVARKSGAI